MKISPGTFFLFVLFAPLACCAPDNGFQHTLNEPLKIIYDSTSLSIGSKDTYPTVSPNGRFIANMGTRDDRFLHIIDIDHGTNSVEYDVAGYSDLKTISFSPDSQQILLAAGGMNPNPTYIFRERTMLSLPIQVTDSCYQKQMKCSADRPLFSPDGKQIMVRIRTIYGDKEFLEKQAALNNRMPRHALPYTGGAGDFSFPSDMPLYPRLKGHPLEYVAVFPSNSTMICPEPLVEGDPQFWSTDEKSIYYSTDRLNRFDLTTKKSEPLFPLTGDGHRILLGKVWGADAVFVFKDGIVKIISLIPHETYSNMILENVVRRIPVRDKDGRSLDSIQMTDTNRLLLIYSTFGPLNEGPPIDPVAHVQLVEY